MDSIPSQLLLQFILILVNAFFAATEIAVLSLNATQLEKKAEEGEKTAKRLLQLTQEPAGFLSTIQIGITLAGFLGSAFAADNFSEYLVNWIYHDLGMTTLSLNTLDTLSVILITLILSYFTLVLGELVPKRIAMQKPYEVSKFSCGVVLVVAKVVNPVVKFLSFSTNGILKILHLKTDAQEDSVTEEEILMMIELGEKRGVLDQDESEWLQNIFDFDDTSIREIMTHSVDVISIALDASDDEIVNTIKKTGLSRFPVYEENDENIIGILHVRDYLLNLQTKEKDFKSLLTPAYFIPDSMTADDLFDDMQKKNIHFAIAIDEFGAMSGIITLEDLVEEIVGNIYDEHDAYEQPSIQSLNHYQWKVTGNVLIEDLAEAVNVDLPTDEDYDTVGGYIYSHLRSIPKDGTTKTIHTDQLTFQITKIQNRRIKEVIVTKNESKPQD
ncbi:hemolysin family protein [Candidatus Stoquefichus sp. SB1]|jgi:putative hemolysin|uniref:hemolysin family protein n=1 Tax=Candidatus Stoquefichus sp. SB1 TaxID=1658109 RepID=UPI00067EA8F3|nr:hemolysin family protein [Candidatus Stoquefichus sp. SB1]